MFFSLHLPFFPYFSWIFAFPVFFFVPFVDVACFSFSRLLSPSFLPPSPAVPSCTKTWLCPYLWHALPVLRLPVKPGRPLRAPGRHQVGLGHAALRVSLASFALAVLQTGRVRATLVLDIFIIFYFWPNFICFTLLLTSDIVLGRQCLRLQVDTWLTVMAGGEVAVHVDVGVCDELGVDQGPDPNPSRNQGLQQLVLELTVVNYVLWIM